MHHVGQLSLIAICSVAVGCADHEGNPNAEEIGAGESPIDAGATTNGTETAPSPASAARASVGAEELARSPCVVRVGGRGARDSNNGSAWLLAMATVQAGIERAQMLALASGLATCSVWIRSGTFNSSTPAGFALRTKVGLFGGFMGTEVAANQRVAGYKSTLNGIITADGSAAAVVDAIRVPLGLSFSNGTVSVNDCSFSGSGAGITGGPGGLTIAKSEFTNGGDAVSCQCGIAVSASAFYNGGTALQTAGGRTVTVSDSRFIGVRSAIQVNEGYANVTNSTFSQITGTAINIYDGHLTANSSVFDGNGGTSIALGIAGGSIANCRFWNNASTCISVTGTPSTANVTQSTFSNNWAPLASVASVGGFYVQANFSRSIIWGNGSSAVVTSGNGAVAYTNSDVEGGPLGTGVLNTDPTFVDSANGDLHLDSASPLLNMGWGYQYP